MQISEVGVTGCRGRVGSRLVKRGARPLDFDITNTDLVIPEGIKLVINCAGESGVDFCERNPDRCASVNVHGVHNLVNACYPKRVSLVHLSSDHVFNGKRWFGAYKENDKLSPVNTYGMSKVIGEAFVAGYTYGKVIRTSMLFDNPRDLYDYKADYVSTCIKRTFMYIEGFVDCLVYYIENFDKMPKVLNVSGTERVSWFDFMTRVRFVEQKPNKYKRKWWYSTNMNLAPRPINAGLDTTLAQKLGVPVEPLQSGLWRWWGTGG